MNYAQVNGVIVDGTVTYTVDLTSDVSLGWTPKAAIIVLSGAVNYESEQAHAAMSIGFTDGTNHFAVSIASSDAAFDSVAIRTMVSNAVVRLYDSVVGVQVTATFNSWITDGIRLNVTGKATGFTSRKVVVHLFGGDDLTALVGNGNLGTGTSAVNFTGLGAPANLAFFISTGDATALPAVGSTHGVMSVGFGIPGTSQGVVGVGITSASATSVGVQIIRNDSVAGQWLNGSESWRASLGSHASGFSLTPSANAGSDIVGYLALAFDGAAWTGIVDLPDTAASDWVVSGPGFEPIGVGLVATALTANNTMDTTTGAMAIALAASDGVSEGSIAIRDDAGLATTDTASYASDEFLYYDDPAGALLYRMAGLDMTATGFKVPIAGLTTVPGTAYKALAFAFGATGSTEAPTVTSAAVNSAGSTITLNFSEAVTVGSGGSGGLSVTASVGSVTLTYSSGSGTTALVYSTSRTICEDEVVTVSYVQPGDGLEATTGGADVGDFSDAAVTNNSTTNTISGNTSPVSANTRTLQLSTVVGSPSWSSDDTDVMSVSGSGLVTLLQASGGVASITDGIGTDEVEFLPRVPTWAYGNPSGIEGVGEEITVAVTLTGYGDGASVGTYPDVSPSCVAGDGVTFDGFTGTEPSYTANFTATEATGPYTAFLNGVEREITPGVSSGIDHGARMRRLLRP